jgi:hypothetical protein
MISYLIENNQPIAYNGSAHSAKFKPAKIKITNVP